MNIRIQKMLDKELKRIGKNDLGVYIRGTDYTNLKPKGHPIQPKLEMLENKIDDFIDKYSEIKNIYLVTEDKTIFFKLKKKYKDMLIVSYEENMIEYTKKEMLYLTLKDSNVLDQASKYLVKILVLSRCKYLITSITNGSVCAMAFNGDEYKDKYIFDLGIY